MKWLDRKLYLPLLFIILLSGCSQNYTPKPKGYNRIDLPTHKYDQLQEKVPYTFEYSAHAKVLEDSSYIAEPTWVDIYYPDFNANVQITYKNLQDTSNNMKSIIEDSHKLVSKHKVKANAVRQTTIRTEDGHTATLFELGGEVPSQFQFYTTDSTRNFLRGALYFRTATKNDSLRPVIDYIKEDVMHMLETLKWKHPAEK